MNEELKNLLDDLEEKEIEIIRLKQKILVKIKSELEEQINKFFSKILVNKSNDKLMIELEKCRDIIQEKLDHVSDTNYPESIRYDLINIKKYWKDYIQDGDTGKILCQLSSFH